MIIHSTLFNINLIISFKFKIINQEFILKKEEFKKIFHQIKEKIKKDRRIIIGAVALALILTFYFFSLLKEKKIYVF